MIDTFNFSLDGICDMQKTYPRLTKATCKYCKGTGRVENDPSMNSKWKYSECRFCYAIGTWYQRDLDEVGNSKIVMLALINMIRVKAIPP